METKTIFLNQNSDVKRIELPIRDGECRFVEIIKGIERMRSEDSRPGSAFLLRDYEQLAYMYLLGIYDAGVIDDETRNNLFYLIKGEGEIVYLP